MFCVSEQVRSVLFAHADDRPRFSASENVSCALFPHAERGVVVAHAAHGSVAAINACQREAQVAPAALMRTRRAMRSSAIGSSSTTT